MTRLGPIDWRKEENKWVEEKRNSDGVINFKRTVKEFSEFVKIVVDLLGGCKEF